MTLMHRSQWQWYELNPLLILNDKILNQIAKTFPVIKFMIIINSTTFQYTCVHHIKISQLNKIERAGYSWAL